MNKFWAMAAIGIIFGTSVRAQSSITPSYIEEMKALGTVSGTGMACGAPKYATFEMLARAILVTKAVSDKSQEEGMIAYNTAKADAFLSKQADGLFNCNEINARFNEQKIFKTVLYGDGTIKMYDGKVYYPRHAYDATLLKDDENVNRQDAVEIYNRAKKRSQGRKKAARSEDGKSLDMRAAATLPRNVPTSAAPLPSSAVRASEFGNNTDSGIGHISNKKR
ncbi:MAG: hypothetical protein IJ689_04385 [Alphaproteobacteria bacterium]|nr:hypothetical protein [Alphaproteobacteria bacterium]